MRVLYINLYIFIFIQSLKSHLLCMPHVSLARRPCYQNIIHNIVEVLLKNGLQKDCLKMKGMFQYFHDFSQC